MGSLVVAVVAVRHTVPVVVVTEDQVVGLAALLVYEAVAVVDQVTNNQPAKLVVLDM